MSRCIAGAVGLLLSGCAESGPREPFGAEATRSRASAEARVRLRAGDGEGAVVALRASGAAHGAAGAWSAAIGDLQAAAWAALYSAYEPDAAREALRMAEAWLEHEPELRALHPYYEGLLALRTADLGGAVERFEEARRRLTSVGGARWLPGVEEALAEALVRLGRAPDAEATLERVRAAASPTACESARRAGNAAWVELLLAELSGEPPSARSRAELEGALAGYADPACGLVQSLPSARLNLALAHLLAREVDDAERVLSETTRSQPRLDERWLRLEIEARIALARGQPGVARGLLGDALDAPADPLWPGFEWRLFLLRARSARALGDDAAALADLARAERGLADALHAVPLGQGRTTLVEATSEVAAEWASLLLARGRPEDAECVVRRFRARPLAAAARRLRLEALAPRDRERWAAEMAAFTRLRSEDEVLAVRLWEAPVDALTALQAERRRLREAAHAHLERAHAVLGPHATAFDCVDLPQPVAGELFLTFVRLPEGTSVVLARDASAVTAHAFAGAESEGAWIEGLDAAIERARRIRLAVEIPGDSTRLHASSWRGAPLGLARETVYGLDLPTSTRRRSPGARTALLVADPTRNLPGARSEALGVTVALGARGWPLVSLTGASATPERVRQALATVELFHFAGHGRAEVGANWEDALELGGRPMSAADVLALPVVPRQVVMTGCRTARARGRREVERVGLAQAFLLSGSEVVIAPTDDIDDVTAEAFGRELYESEPSELVRAHTEAARRLDARGLSGWRAFQVWVP